MSDRELLELAAKAAGIEYTWDTWANAPMVVSENGVDTDTWNPLVDDGDALRLAVALRLVVHIWDNGESVSAAKTLPNGDDPPSGDLSSWSSADANSSGDLASATRRAIVRAAAKIGQANG